MKKITIEIKPEDMPKRRMPVVINQHGSAHLPKNISRRRKGKKQALRRETNEFL